MLNLNNQLNGFMGENNIRKLDDLMLLKDMTQKVVNMEFPLCLEDFLCSQKPFFLSVSKSETITKSINVLFDQIRIKQKNNPETIFFDTIVRCLVAATLSVILSLDKLYIYSASVADSQTDRSGDFVISNTILHCTTAPGEPLIQKCKANIHVGCQPIIITIYEIGRASCRERV